MLATALITVQFAGSALAATAFLEQLHRAQARDAKDPERIEFASRAIREWLPADGKPLLAAAHFARAEGEIELFDDSAAEEDLSKTLDNDPRNGRALLLRSKARASLGQGLLAERDALDYLDGHGDDAQGWLALGEARLTAGPPKADSPARTAFARAANILGSEDPRPSLGDGRSQLAMRRPREALPFLSAAAENPQKRRAEILTWRSRAYSELGDWSAARSDLTRALPELERVFDDRRHSGAVKRGQDAARKTLADAYFRRGLANEAMRDREPALADHRQACNLGLPLACARVEALEKPEPKEPVPPKVRKPKHRKNPKGDSGDRVYAN